MPDPRLLSDGELSGAWVMSDWTAISAHIAALTAENARLRKVLTAITKDGGVGAPGRMRAIAFAALAEAPHD